MVSEAEARAWLGAELFDLYAAMRGDIDRFEQRRSGAPGEDFEWRQLVVESRAPWRNEGQLDWSSGGDRARPRWRKEVIK